jgi:hypothetical protein
MEEKEAPGHAKRRELNITTVFTSIKYSFMRSQRS